MYSYPYRTARAMHLLSVCALVLVACEEIDGNEVPGGGSICVRDTDGDGFGARVPGCTASEPPGSAPMPETDCDDTRNTVHPGAAEACDGLDNDCDGLVDEGALNYCGSGCRPGHANMVLGGDCGEVGHGECAYPGVASCGGELRNIPICALSRDRPLPTPEVCDGLDNDCNGLIDEANPTAPAWYVDCDRDGIPLRNSPLMRSCAEPTLAVNAVQQYCASGTSGVTRSSPEIYFDCNDADAASGRCHVLSGVITKL